LEETLKWYTARLPGVQSARPVASLSSDLLNPVSNEDLSRSAGATFERSAHITIQ
jgi:hypothetical protein